MNTTTSSLQERIQTMPMLGCERAHVLQSYVAAEALVDAMFSVARWVNRAVAARTGMLDKHAVSH